MGTGRSHHLMRDLENHPPTPPSCWAASFQAPDSGGGQRGRLSQRERILPSPRATSREGPGEGAPSREDYCSGGFLKRSHALRMVERTGSSTEFAWAMQLAYCFSGVSTTTSVGGS